MLKRTLIALGLSASLSVLFSTSLLAKPDFPPHEPGMEMLRELRQLELSKDQRQNIRYLVKTYRDETEALRSAERPEGFPSPDRFVSTSVDEATLTSEIEAGMEQRRSIKLKTAKLRNQIYQLLTAEQQDELAQSEDQQGPRHPRGEREGPLEQLDLTEDQIAQLEPLKQQRSTLMQQAKEQHKTYRDAEQELIQQPQLDEDKWIALTLEQEQSAVTQAVAMAKVHAAMMSVLTETQREELLDDMQAYRPRPMHRD